MGSLSGTLGEDQPFRYRGYVYDSDTELYYLQSRYYDPTTCRFISADVLLSTGQGVIGHNSFAYCLNNPIKSVDSDGKLGLLATILIGAAIGAIVNVVTNGIANVTDDDPETGFFSGAGWAALEGGLSGALAASPIGVVGQVVGNALISGGCSVAKQATDNLKGIDWVEVGFDTVIGGLSGYAGGKGAHCRKVSYSSLKNGFVKSSYLQPKGFVKRMAWDRLSRSLKTSFKIGSAYKAAKNTFRWVKKGFIAAKRALGW